MTPMAYLYICDGDIDNPVLTHKKMDWPEKYPHWQEIPLVMAQPEQDWDAVAEKRLAALKQSTKTATEDAAVRAVHKQAQDRGLIDIGRIFTPEKVQSEPPPEFIDALKFDVAKRDSDAQQAYEDAFVNGAGVMLGDKRVDPASIYKEPEQDPVAEVVEDDFSRQVVGIGRWHRLPNGTKLYASPPPRKPWVGLTDEERADVYKSIHAKDFCVSAVAIAIEAKLKEKNT